MVWHHWRTCRVHSSCSIVHPASWQKEKPARYSGPYQAGCDAKEKQQQRYKTHVKAVKIIIPQRMGDYKMNKWELLKSFIFGMFCSAEVTGEKSIQRTITKIIAQMDKLEKEEKEVNTQAEASAE